MICINCDSAFHRRSLQRYLCFPDLLAAHFGGFCLMAPTRSPVKLTTSPRCFEHLAFGNINAALTLLAEPPPRGSLAN